MDGFSFVLLFLTIPNSGPPEINLEDAHRFGLTREQARECREFNRACYQHVEAQMIMSNHNGRYWELVKDEIQSRYHLWDWLADALPDENGGNCWGEENRKDWLFRLRERIGVDA